MIARRQLSKRLGRFPSRIIAAGFFITSELKTDDALNFLYPANHFWNNSSGKTRFPLLG
jgi:hypothetical protein